MNIYFRDNFFILNLFKPIKLKSFNNRIIKLPKKYTYNLEIKSQFITKHIVLEIMIIIMLILIKANRISFTNTLIIDLK
jgi:hypothetical protein